MFDFCKSNEMLLWSTYVDQSNISFDLQKSNIFKHAKSQRFSNLPKKSTIWSNKKIFSSSSESSDSSSDSLSESFTSNTFPNKHINFPRNFTEFSTYFV